ncbi:class I SAM-dependent methyltransferase [Propionispora vibrioides]|uniref:Methyltransferase domain-containing protein n=1 Tax=Propionispora vibrioides TaxID=112903 RepID=A0A1H8S0Y5_9FIRM|nr:class I SAM-dependent methyltransferase [Propionispora vibrioides]SEO72351.1 Methyltransferase domain-containing protein [Propionispora vibrioides]
MNTQDKIFKSYKAIRSDFLYENRDQRNNFIDNLFKTHYLPHISRKKEEGILEIGCNRGYMLSALRKYGFTNVEGIDLSLEDIKMAKDMGFCAESTNVFDHLDGNRKYDVIISKDVMEHIPKDRQEEFVKRVYDALQPGGVALVQVPNMDWMFSNHERYMDFTHEIGYTRESLADMYRLYFSGDQVEVVPASYIFLNTLKQKIIFGFVRPILLKMLRLFFKILGEGACDIWFEHREILVIAKKEDLNEKNIGNL